MFRLLQQTVHQNCKKEIIYIKTFCGRDHSLTDVVTNMCVCVCVYVTVEKLHAVENKCVVVE
jgi:hypothetical protein